MAPGEPGIAKKSCHFRSSEPWLSLEAANSSIEPTSSGELHLPPAAARVKRCGARS
jgi:hypothetical protein